MLLRRITTHVKEQNWFAVIIDFFIVVVGVFIGLQVANWNDEQQVRQNEISYLERLDKEFDVVRARLKSGKNTFEESVHGISLLLKTHRQYATNQDQPIPSNEILGNAIRNTTSGRVPAGSPAAFKEMISKGALDTLSSAELRQALFEYDEFAGIARDAWHTIRDEQHRSANNLLWLLDIEAPSNLESGNHLLVTPKFVGFDLNIFLNTHEMRGYLSVLLRAQLNQYSLVAQQLVLTEKIEQLIAEERARF